LERFDGAALSPGEWSEGEWKLFGVYANEMSPIILAKKIPPAVGLCALFCVYVSWVLSEDLGIGLNHLYRCVSGRSSVKAHEFIDLLINISWNVSHLSLFEQGEKINETITL
jgi:hypothetical protein